MSMLGADGAPEPAAGAIAAPWYSRISVRQIEARHVRDYGIIAITVLLFIGLSFASGAFFTVGNILNIIYQNTPLAIMACTTTVVIITGNFDLSVGSMFAVAAVGSAYVANLAGTPAGVLFGVVVGGLMGLMNGLIVTKLRINAFLATLATNLALRGLIVALTYGYLVNATAGGFTWLGRTKVGPVPILVFIIVVIGVVLQMVMSRTVFGRYIYATGGNRAAATISGLPVHRIVLAAFTIGGLGCGLAGVLDASSVASGDPQAGAAYGLTAVAAVALGGTSIFGGSGSIWRTFIGVALFALITNGFNIMGLNPYYQDIAKGALIIFAVALSAAVEKRGAM